MKALQINATYGIGSTGTIVKDLHELSMNQGIDSYVAYSLASVRPKNIKNGYKIGWAFGKKIHALFCRINGKQGYFSRCATKRLIKYITKINPDVVHLHNLHSNYINLNMLLQYLAIKDIKTIVTLHDCWFYTGGCFHYTAAGCDKWLKDCGNCPKKKLDTPALLFDCSAKILEDRKKYFSAIKDLTVVGVSDWITREATKTVFKNAKSLAIHNGIDTEIFKPTNSNFKEQYNIQNKFVVLGPASKWLSSVNLNIFQKFVATLTEDEKLVLLGCTNKQIKNLPTSVIGLPFIKDKSDLSKIYTAADVFVNPTREESLSLINVEAQACGTPVITFANTGVQETVDNEYSFAVQNDNLEAVIEKIKLVKSLNKSLVSSNLQNRIENEFNKDKNYQAYINLYKSGVSDEFNKHII
jgi:glycosyltransferase involved in cell wall biosynthesis